jgi:hypothetical protein
MLIRSSGGRFELEYGCGLSFFLKAPVVGEMYLRGREFTWDKPSEVRAARERFVAHATEELKALEQQVKPPVPQQEHTTEERYANPQA